MNHKRGRRKNARAGCLLCKPHKANGAKGTANAQVRQERQARTSEREQRAEVGVMGWARGVQAMRRVNEVEP